MSAPSWPGVAGPATMLTRGSLGLTAAKVTDVVFTDGPVTTEVSDGQECPAPQDPAISLAPQRRKNPPGFRPPSPGGGREGLLFVPG